MTTDNNILITPPRSDDDVSAFVAILNQALLFPLLDEYDWVQRVGRENLRLAIRDGQIAGGLILIRMGQWFGRKSVSMTGISGVGVAPHHRGKGVASTLMKAVVREIHEEGTPLSALYPATQPVYRQAGYEMAGARIGYRMPTSALIDGSRTLETRPIEKADHAVVYDLYRERARRTGGNLDRIRWGWDRIFEPRVGTPYGYLIEREGQAEGYIVFKQVASDFPRYDIEVMDFAALTRDAGLRLLTLLADHRSMTSNFTWYGAPSDPLTTLIRDQHFDIFWRLDWMLRVIDVKSALEQRGYPSGLNAELHLEVADESLPHNHGRFVLEVGDGEGRAQAGGKGSVRIDVRGLAQLYSGYLSPLEMQSTGLIDGAEEDLAVAQSIFAGPAPWMSEIF